MVLIKRGLDGRIKEEVLDEFGMVRYIPLTDLASQRDFASSEL